MTTWNYRVAKNEDGELFIVEVYYDDNDVPQFWSGSQKPYGEDIGSLRTDLEYMLEALDKPIFEKIVEET